MKTEHKILIVSAIKLLGFEPQIAFNSFRTAAVII